MLGNYIDLCTGEDLYWSSTVFVLETWCVVVGFICHTHGIWPQVSCDAVFPCGGCINKLGCEVLEVPDPLFSQAVGVRSF